VYVGLYGYGYLEAGKNVISLFKNRGWEAIIADDLIGNGEITSLLCWFVLTYHSSQNYLVFFFLSVCVGLICTGKKGTFTHFASRHTTFFSYVSLRCICFQVLDMQLVLTKQRGLRMHHTELKLRPRAQGE
jgi:hypothetical protein